MSDGLLNLLPNVGRFIRVSFSMPPERNGLKYPAISKILSSQKAKRIFGSLSRYWPAVHVSDLTM